MTPAGFPKPCAHPGCRALVTSGRCEKHRRKADRARGSAAERGYDSRWTRLRNWFIRAHPLCAWCAESGRTSAAQIVDHIVPIRAGGARLEESNLQSLCRSCHAKKTAQDLAG
ncbi:MAG: HNH endonuclease [Gammaproteobacteria bacterium]|nr:MAG: HNH endonuclease [Gammaproteobacteria bacterium]